MKIKRLEISGFKSFADKVVLNFQQGITGIVGPNGCGKSNVVDAIRWCMGEQSAKNLRGKAMEDVIFAGSESRKPLGVAEVSLIFSTEDGRAPAKYLDYAEIQLTRRLFRDGESDYLINKVPCRLMDITELFMDTGVGTRAYSIIEQGKIGMILHSRPEERRFLIEEAAGVTKFKARKQLALRKIDATRQNLARLTDVLSEIKRQLSSLQRQAKKAEKFREYRDEMRAAEILFSAQEYRQLQAERQTAEQELQNLNTRMREAFAATSLGESRSEEARVLLLEAEKRLGVEQEELFRIRSAFGTTENALEFQRKELEGVRGRLTRLEAELSGLDKRLSECAEQRSLLELRRDSGATDEGDLSASLEQAEAAQTSQLQAVEQLQRQMEERRSSLFNTMATASQFRSRQEMALKRQTGLDERVARQGREVSQLGERRTELQQRADQLEKEITLLQAEKEQFQQEQAALRSRDDEVRVKLPEVEKAWQTARDELTRSASRLHSLKELEAQFAGYGQGVRTLMKDSARRSRFSGVVADSLQVPSDLEAAVEAVLADRLQCILCADEQDALQALEFLNGARSGRASLGLPVDAARPELPRIDGAEPLLDRVQASGPFAGLITQLLAPVMLVATITDAIALGRRHPSLTFATPAGEIVTAGGLVSGGAAGQSESGLIHKKREIRELEERVAALEREHASRTQERDELRRSGQECSEGLKRCSTLLHQTELKLAGLTKDRQRMTEEGQRVAERLEVLGMESGSLQEEREALTAELALAASELAQSDVSIRELEQGNAALKTSLEEQQVQLTAVRERVTSLRVQAAALKEQREGCLRALSDLERQETEVRSRRENDQKEIAEGTETCQRLETEIAAAATRLQELIGRQTTAEQSLAAARSAVEGAGSALAEHENRFKQAREEGEAIRQAQTDLNLKFATVSMQSEHLERTILERSRISMSEALARLEGSSIDEAALKQRQTELQRLLDEMGEVNLMAIEECAGMEERFTFLSSQKDDLEESMRSLQQAIQRINRTTRQRFQETYDLVNAKFQEVFPRLFCGGRAELRLTNEDDLLETGIDIIAQPPGKKLQNVTLLSGGEKALTAVALIFSIFMIKPTPFCLLDEVDAPLDDANIGRFNEMVREMSAISQFIIITHNKTTMQVADTLYGITMEEPGASKVVSVRLH